MTNYYTQEQLQLANEIAQTLNDTEAIRLHLSYVQRYDEQFLRSKLEQAMKVPEHLVRTSRAALYVSLVEHAQFSNPRS